MEEQPRQNKLGFAVHAGAVGQAGGDTELSSELLFYCGQFRGECRCGTCDGYCGPNDGCPCNACVELLDFKVNKLKHLCQRGTIDDEFVTGQEIEATGLYYCGRQKKQCYCGECDEFCGPDGGCPCLDCLEILDMRVNEAGHFCKRGPSEVTVPHLNDVPSSQFYYCGRSKDEFECDTCTGICEASNGCPCCDCLQPMEFKFNRRGISTRRGRGTEIAGHTGLPSNKLFYCNQRRSHCHCGNCGPICGPSSGCPCYDCLELLELVVLPERFERRICQRNKSEGAGRDCACEACQNVDEHVRNSRGHIALKGGYRGTGGFTKIDPKNLYYCGVSHNECRCNRCDTRCGPANGCPCKSCFNLYLDKEFPPEEDEVDGATIDRSCVVCLKNQKRVILIPCGHYLFCVPCAYEVDTCSVCRAPIDKRVKAFESSVM